MKALLTIAVISDTHNRYPESLVEQLAPADEIWHLGDVGDPSIAESLRQPGKPMCIVQGNTDLPYIWKEKSIQERHGYKFQLQHYPPSREIFGIDAILHGHLHVPINTRIGNTKVLSPGAISGPRDGTAAGFAWLRFFEKSSWTWDRVELIPSL